MEPKTETDRFILQQVAASLRSDERVIVCAYLVPPVEGGTVGVFLSAATAMAAFAAITSGGLILVQTRIGAVKPLLENHGVVNLERSAIKGVHVGARLLIELSDGRTLEYLDNRASGYVSTQREFFERLESTFGRSQSAAMKASSDRLLAIIGTIVGVIVAAAYLYYRLAMR